MSAPRLALAALVPGLLTAGCFLSPHGPAKAQEAAMDLNVNSRFGRTEIAAEKVAPKGREDYFEHRRGWGGKVRIADTELAGLKMQGDDDAEVSVRVAWYAMNEGELRVTILKQTWHDFKGDWKFVSEVRADGDVGLIGEKIPAPDKTSSDAPPRPRNAQFPAVRLNGDRPAPQPEPTPEPPATAAAELSPP
jgi:hypothetical protein